MSQWDFGTSAGGFPDDGGEDDFEAGFSPISYERDPGELDPYARGPYEPPGATRTWEAFDELWPEHPHAGHPGRRARSGPLRWLVPAVIVTAAAAAGAAVVLLGGSGDPSAPATPSAPAAPLAPSAPAAPLTIAQARQVVASYTTANNEANAELSDAVLSTIETGSSYAIDAGSYRVQRAEGAAPYPAFGPQHAQYYIPRQETGYPRWFAVQVGNAALASPTTVTGTEYLVFTQAAAGAPWLNAIEPYVLSGAVSPQIAVGAGGLATAVSPAAASLAVAPSQLPALTAASLDGAQGGGEVVANPGNLADVLAQAAWRKTLATASVTDRHAPAGGPVFGLLTTDGGALLFYTDSAELTLAAPAGEALQLTVPGFYSPGQAVTTAGIGYLEQFATYVPPRGGSGLRVVADYSGITAAN